MAPLDVAAMPLQPDTHEALAFLVAIGGRHHLTAIPTNGGPPKGLAVEVPRDVERAATWIAAHNAKGMGIYWTANEVRADFTCIKASKADVAMLRAVWLDLDCDKGTPESAMLDRLRAFGVVPSLVVHSGGGLQPVWLLDQPVPADAANVEALEALGRDLRGRLGGDAVEDVARVLRVPGTVNWPNATKRERGRVPALARQLDVLDGATVLTGDRVSLAVLRAAVEAARILPEFESGAGSVTGAGGAVTLPGVRPAIFDGDTTAGSGVQALQSGMEPRGSLLVALPEDQRVPFLRAMLKAVAPACGEREPWMQVIRALRSVEDHVPEVHAEALAWSRDMAPGWTSEADFERAWVSSPPKPGGTTVGTLIAMAKEAGLDVAPWAAMADPARAQRISTANGAQSDRPASKSPADVLHWMNERFGIMESTGTRIHVRAPGGPCPLTRDAFDVLTANILVNVPNAKGAVVAKPAGSWWMAHEDRRCIREIVYARPDIPMSQVVDAWTGFAVQPSKGRWALLARHIYDVICDRDRAAFRFLIGAMAHAVQRPGFPLGCAVILKGGQGAGKSLLLRAMAELFGVGRHAQLIDTPEALLGRFTPWRATTTFVGADEVAFAGDKAFRDKLKAVITASHVQVEGKGANPITVNNALHLFVTTNSEWAVDAERDDRRFFVLNVSARRQGDKAYFDALFRQTFREGGVAALLYSLQKYDLRKFDVRDMPLTAGRFEEKLRSAPIEVEWIRACHEAGGLIGDPSTSGGLPLTPGKPFRSDEALARLRAWAVATGNPRRLPSADSFRKWLADCGAVVHRTSGARLRVIPDLRAFTEQALRRATGAKA